jgi:RNA polymerase sigma factor (sigma-70 family)
LTETELIHKVAAQDAFAFRALFESYKSLVYNTSLKYLQNISDAEDLTQDVFIEINRSASHFKGESSVKTWIYRITVNKCLDQLRHRNRKKRFGFLTSLFAKDSGELIIDVPHFHHPGVLLENKEKAALLFKLIDQLPEKQKTAFFLAHVDELPQKEVAEIMNVSVKAVESLIQRAKANIRNELEKHYPEQRDLHE